MTSPTPQERLKWPEGISDGLVLLCGKCSLHTDFDYTIADDVWRRIVPDELRLGVVCLSCLDELAGDENVLPYIKRVQFTGRRRTAGLVLEMVYEY